MGLFEMYAGSIGPLTPLEADSLRVIAADELAREYRNDPNADRLPIYSSSGLRPMDGEWVCHLLDVDSAHERIANAEQLSVVGIHREFADLSGSVDEIQGFMSKYGNLRFPLTPYHSRDGLHSVCAYTTGHVSQIWLCESVEAWRAEISLIRECLWIHTDDSRSALEIGPPDGSGIHTRFPLWLGDPKAVEYVYTPNPIHARKAFLAHLVDRNIQDAFKAEFRFTPSRYELDIRTHDLAGVIWRELIREIESGTEWFKCDGCREWRPKRRIDQVQCGNACRSKARRRQSAMAYDLSAEGVSIAGIAERLNSEFEASFDESRVERLIADAVKARARAAESHVDADHSDGGES